MTGKILAAACAAALAGTFAYAGHHEGGDGHGKHGDMKKGEHGKRHHHKMEFSDLDSDGNGSVSLDEFLAHHRIWIEKKFAKIDADGNGGITEAEMKAARERMKEHHGKHMKKGDGEDHQCEDHEDESDD